MRVRSERLNGSIRCDGFCSKGREIVDRCGRWNEGKRGREQASKRRKCSGVSGGSRNSIHERTGSDRGGGSGVIGRKGRRVVWEENEGARRESKSDTRQ